MDAASRYGISQDYRTRRAGLPAPARTRVGRPLLRTASAPALILRHEAASAQRRSILAHPQVRGVGGSGETFDALRAMAAGKPVLLPLFWGFRALRKDENTLHAAERNTMRAYLQLVQQLGPHCQPLLILADVHAEHNGISKPTWRAYYATVEEHAAALGLQVRYLSSILASLSLSAETLEQQGKELVERPSGATRVGAVRLTGKEWSQLKLQAEHLCKRFPEQFPVPEGESKRRALYDPRALAYARFRAAEGRLLLPRLPEAFARPVLPVHVTDPANERIGVRGLAIHARDAADANTVHIPWK